MNNNAYSRNRFEQRIYNAIISTIQEENQTPETVLVAISPDMENIVTIGTYANSTMTPEMEDWNIEEIDTENLSDNISEVAGFYFDPRYYNR